MTVRAVMAVHSCRDDCTLVQLWLCTRAVMTVHSYSYVVLEANTPFICCVVGAARAFMSTCATKADHADVLAQAADTVFFLCLCNT